jgi:hypothetical protein
MLLEPWIETYTGKQLHFLDPKPEEIDIEDIANALSNECRYGGHTSSFYSVAEHSLLVASIVEADLALKALLHDASEAYLRDIASPVKQYLSNYKEMEEKLMRAIWDKFFGEGQVRWDVPDIKEADIMALKCEARQLMPSKGSTWIHLYPTEREVNPKLHCMSPKEAKQVFLQAFNQITGKSSPILVPSAKELVIAR